MQEYSPSNPSRVMSRDEVRAVDRWAIETIGVPGVVLMENAGRSCAELAMEKLAGVAHPRVCVFCGTGNNGGDGCVIARHLLNARMEVRVAVCGRIEKVRGDAKVNLDALVALGHAPEQMDAGDPDLVSRVDGMVRDADMIIDALFGTGLQGPLRADCRSLVEQINASGCPVLAVDIPSGLDCDSGEPLGAAVRAAYTVTFVAAKKGFLSDVARRYTGEVHVASIGVEPSD